MRMEAGMCFWSQKNVSALLELGWQGEPLSVGAGNQTGSSCKSSTHSELLGCLSSPVLGIFERFLPSSFFSVLSMSEVTKIQILKKGHTRKKFPWTDESASCQQWSPEFDPQDQRGGKREPTSESFPLTSVKAPSYLPTHPHKYINVKKLEFVFKSLILNHVSLLLSRERRFQICDLQLWVLNLWAEMKLLKPTSAMLSSWPPVSSGSPGSLMSFSGLQSPVVSSYPVQGL